ncbi:MAG: Uma2 family endonuclease [Deltaproteobacteria bacterium]|nr:Uma2 family endonuclease [Deltaproteobacteria bacterium]
MAATTHAVVPPAHQPVEVSAESIWRLSVDQYHAMIQAGILTDDDPVELLEGWLVTKMSKNPKHRVVTQLIREAIAQILPTGWYVDVQEPVTTKDSEPEPNVAVVRGNRRQYFDHHPSPQDIALVVEVADSSLRRDRTLKKRIYAAAGISIYWIVNLLANEIEVHSEPSEPSEQPDYRQQQTFGLEDTIAIILHGREIGSLSVRELLS